MRLKRLARSRSHRHRHIQGSRGGQPEIEVLAQQRGREGRGPVQIDQRVGFVARENRTHHAIVDEVQKGMARHAGLLRQYGDLGKVLDHNTEKDVVSDLADTRQLTLADIGDAAWREGEDVRLNGLECLFRARRDHT